MSLRDLVTGSDMCTASNGAGPSNAVGALVNQLLGGASKTQEQLRDLPVHHPGGAGPSHVVGDPAAAAAAALGVGPGQAMRGPMQLPPHLEDLWPAAAAGPGPSSAMAAARRAGLPPDAAAVEAMVGEFQRLVPPGGSSSSMMGRLPGGPLPPQLPPPPQVTANLKAFLDGAMAGAGLPPGALLPPPGASGAPLSMAQAVRVRDRATILARQLAAEAGPAAADAQVAALLSSLSVDPAALPAGLHPLQDAAWHDLWAAGAAPAGQQPWVAAEMAAAAAAAAGGSAGLEEVWAAQQRQQQLMAGPRPGLIPRPPSTGWAEEFSVQQQQQQPLAGPSAATTAAPAPGASWAEEFTATDADRWAGEFSEQQATASSDAAAAAARRAVGEEEARAQSARLVAALSQGGDPKMAASKFMQFLSKMSRGELSFQDNQVVERPPGEAWAHDFAAGQQQQQQAAASGPGDWAQEFAASHHPQQQQQQQGGAGPSVSTAAAIGRDWADAFANGVAGDLQIGEDEASTALMEEAWAALGQAPGGAANPWVTEFEGGAAAAGDIPGEWEELYGAAAVGGAAGLAAAAAAAGGVEYVFAADNPFRGDPEALEKGKDLFKRGLLSEAALALEAAVAADPGAAEVWRLLGTVHAENDDDKQAIAALGKALAADPNNLEVLLSLGVSHANELEAGQALTYLATWLRAHPDHGPAAGPTPPDSSQALAHVLACFEGAVGRSPGVADLHMALGVLHHLGRSYDAAIQSFQRALELRPQDYSLWNKLGATLANYSHSGDALAAYQRALDLKPNYMRAWTNMGISYANLGDYTTSAAYYTRALQLNPEASHVWGYLRTSAACAGRGDLMAAVEAQDLGALAEALPL